DLLLLLGELNRGFDADLDIHVAAGGRAQHAHALALEAELLAGLGPGRDVHLGARALDGRHLDGAAESGRGEGDRHPAMNVGAVALEHAMRLQRQEDIEVAGWCAAHPRLALAGQADARAFLDAGGNVDAERALLAQAPGALAHLAGPLDHLAGAVAALTGALGGEEALGRARPAMAVAGG